MPCVGLTPHPRRPTKCPESLKNLTENLLKRPRLTVGQSTYDVIVILQKVRN
jgi:hypothetical protein